MEKQKLIIDVDSVIESYNKKNPEKLPLNRKLLADKVGVNPQVFSDWKSGKKTPKWAYILMKFIEIGQIGTEDLIKKMEKDDQDK